MLSVALALLGCSPSPQFNPVADAGPDVVVAPGVQGVLSGSGTDEDGGVDTFEWLLIGAPPGSTATVSGNGPQAAVSTDLSGTYTVGLTVVDDDGNRSTMDVANVHAVTANGMPEAAVVATGTLGTGEDLTLDGTASSDPDGDPLRYYFSIVLAPEGSGSELDGLDEDVPYAGFTPPTAGFYILGLEVDDGSSRSTRADLELRVTDTPNTGPVAVCPGGLSGPVGSEIIIDGGGSYDPDGDTLVYDWELITEPAGSSAVLEGTAGPNSRLTPDVDGVWRIGLSVFDGVLASEQCELTVTGGDGNGNNAPVARAGDDLSSDVGVVVPLDGRDSYDPEGDTLSGAWIFLSTPDGSALTDSDIDNSFSMEAGFTPDAGGTYRIQLEVCDQEPLCDTDTLNVAVIDSGNTAPVADAGPDQTGDSGDSFDLDGSGSFDPDGDTIDYQWTLGSIPAASTLTNADIVDASDVSAQITPDVDGRFELVLEVCDATDCDSDSVTVEAGDVGNTAPVADAGSDATGTVGSTVTLDGSGSNDPDGDPLTYRWGFKSVPSASGLDNDDWTDRTTANGKFTPDEAGDYEIRLTVNDGTEEDSDLVTITVSDGGNTAPVADAGGDTTATTGSSITLDGSGSSDPDGDPLTYRWGFKSAPSGSSVDNSTSWTDRYTDSGSFTPDVDGDYEIRLTVNDGTAEDSDVITVTAASGANSPPVADAGPDQSVSTGSVATMDGTGSSDPDGDPLTYRWGFKSVPAGSSADNATSWTDRYTDSGSFTPDVAGDYEIRLAVDDGSGEVNDLVTITASGGGNAPPTAEAGDDQSSCLLDSAEFNAGSSSDPDGDPLTYKWSLTSVPSGSALTSSDLDGRWKAKVELTPDVAGTYTLEVEVDDGTDTSTDTVDVDYDYDDAVLVLHLDETSGFTAEDSGPNGLDGSVANDDWTGAWTFGGLDFDGTQDIIVPDDDAIDLVNDWSAEFWAKADTATDFEVFFVKPIDSGGTETYAYSFWRDGDDALGFYGLNTDAGVNFLYTTGSNVGDGDWHHYVVNVTSSDGMEIYEDSVLLATGTASVSLDTSADDLEIGSWAAYPGYEFNGVMDEFVLRDVALSSSEIASRYAAGTQFCTEVADEDAPAANITSPSGGESTDLGYYAIEGTASDDSEIVGVRVDGTEAIATSDGFETWVAYVALSTGSNSFTIETEDVAGNIDSGADSVAVTFTDDCYDDYRMVLTFDEDEGGSAVDASSYANDGTGTATDREVGVYGNAASFDGGAAITVPHHTRLSGGSAFTVDFWFQSEATSSTQVLFHKGSYDYGVAIDGSDLFCGVTDTGGTTYTATASSVVDGGWHHAVCTFNTTYLRLYVDGSVEDRVSVGTTSATNSQDLVIGEFSLSTGFEYEGLIDHLRFIALSSTASDVATMYAEGEQCAISSNFGPDGSASASAESASYTAERVIDEETDEDDSTDTTYWLLPTGTTGYVEVDLGELVGLTRLRWLNTHHATRDTAATDAYEIHVSATGAFDGEEEVIASGSGELEDELRHHQVDLSDPVAGRYVRFYVDSYHALRGGLNELEIYGL